MKMLSHKDTEVLVFSLIFMAIAFAISAFFRLVVAKWLLGKELYDLLTNDPRGKQRGKDRDAEMQSAFSSWRKPVPADLAKKIANTSIDGENGRPIGHILGAMRLTVLENEIDAFDWKLMQRGACASIQTVVVVEPASANHVVPDFYLHPVIRRFKIPMVISCYELVDGLEFPNYVLESQGIAHKTRELFRSDRDEGGGQLFEYVGHRGWTVEWSRGRLLVYKFDQCVSPEEVAEFAADVLALSSLIAKTAELMATGLKT